MTIFAMNIAIFTTNLAIFPGYSCYMRQMTTMQLHIIPNKKLELFTSNSIKMNS